MEIIKKRLEEIKPYEKNPRKNDEAVEYVANSIRDFGFKNPIIIDKDGVIVAGHTRLKAAERLGLEEVPCIMADDLTEEQVKAFRLADNKTAELAGWDFELLDLELGDLEDLVMSAYGFEIPVDIYKDSEIGGGYRKLDRQVRCSAVFRPRCEARLLDTEKEGVERPRHKERARARCDLLTA